MSKNLLKEAIADAKAVRETAIANAKLALEEAFTPKLQSMLSAKIQEEDELEDQDTSAETDEMAIADDSTEVGVENDDTEDTNSEEPQEETYDEGEEVEEGEETEEGVYEADEPTEEGEDLEEDEVTEDDAELDEIIKELEEEEEVEEDETMDEAEEVEEDSMDEAEDVEEDETMDEDLDLDEVIRALQEEEDEDAEVTEEDELEEAYATIRSLKATINEVNLLNAKLLFSNKLFRGNDLNESQKMKVIETFDRANSVREVKLVYTTLSESISGYTPKRKKNITEGFASKPTKSTAPKKGVIVEGTDFANRMKKLAGLL